MTIFRTPSHALGLTRPIPDATVARLPLYLRALNDLLDHGTRTCSSDELAELVGTTSAQIRKDLSFLGSHGTRGVGYDVARLQDTVGATIGHDREWPVVVVGAGHLGSALASYQNFVRRGMSIVAVVDIDPALIGTLIGDIPVHDVADLPRLVEKHGVVIGIVATPPQAAQRATDALVEAGVHSILNFAPAVVRAEPGVELRHVDVASELQILAYHEQRRADREVAGT